MASPAFPRQTPPMSSSTTSNFTASLPGYRKQEPVYPEQRIGDYVIGETIGRGSFGKVKKGRHLPTGETVAIKILNRERLKSSQMNEKINREINILKLFSHPNICRLYEVISTPTDMYLIMEYVGCGELYEYIVNCGTVPEDEARYIFQQIICAIEYCHHFRVVHRDLKPENILIGQGLQVKVIDFGLSNVMQDGKFLTTSCGSPNYAAPEVISGKLYIGPEADVWSCGVILYTLLCGSLPFDEQCVQKLFSKIKKGTYPTPQNISSGPRELIKKILMVDSLVRLTIPQIRDCEWFNEKLPTRLMYSKSTFSASDDRIFPTVAGETAQRLRIHERKLREEVERRQGCGYVAYQILLDARRRREIAAEADELGVLNSSCAAPAGVADVYETSTFGSNNTHNYNKSHQQHQPYLDSTRNGASAIDGRGCGNVGAGVHEMMLPDRFSPTLKATEHELNMGMMLTQSPAMEKILELPDATHYKDAYNSSSFLPASAHEANKVSSLCRTGQVGGPYSSLPVMLASGRHSHMTAVHMPDALSSSVESQPMASLQNNRSFCMTRNSLPCSGRHALMPSLMTSDYSPQRRLLHHVEPNSLALEASMGGGGTLTQEHPLTNSCYPQMQQQVHVPHSQQLQQKQHSYPYTQRYPQREHSVCSVGGTSLTGRTTPHVGSVAQKHTTFTHEEKNFIIYNNCGWRVGLMTDRDLEKTLLAICEVLRSLQMQWKTASPFSLMARTTADTWPILSGLSPEECRASVMGCSRSCTSNNNRNISEDNSKDGKGDSCSRSSSNRSSSGNNCDVHSKSSISSSGATYHTDATMAKGNAGTPITHHVSQAISVGCSIDGKPNCVAFDDAADSDTSGGTERHRNAMDRELGNTHGINAAKVRAACNSTTHTCTSSTTKGCSSSTYAESDCHASSSTHRVMPMYSNATTVVAHTRARNNNSGGGCSRHDAHDVCRDPLVPTLHNCASHVRRSTQEQQTRSHAGAEDDENIGEGVQGRRCPAATPPSQPATINIHLFRVFERCEKGFIVDFSVTHNSLIEIEVVLRLSDMLLQKIR